ncbi:hypothetical protein [Lentiprolixibacter aurantiacus]|uniref:Sensor of ECF-type sigma factor n=1 Tax=Lentiprolixibacter aurantiacus TaxID=2993939 RepID=A0AAE3SPI0_9FLAO|nr:hypothetical protein [Lentiprolixibacter aurantiacus]MCX2720241.1 hypothetical protein [Lentiprolixibacter aurantiacus]
MNKLSKIGALLIIMLVFASGYGQRRPAQERIKTLKVAFITERLNLTTDEAQDFWPIYNAHEQNLEALKRQERREIRSKLIDFENLSEREAADLLQQSLELEREKHKLNMQFMDKISQVISAKKAFLLIKAEEDFKKRLLREIQQRRRGNR